ncbi:MAG: LLM class flavin-dependent oxidoreductase [Gammaproteobacteria bacterium]|nr:LLM class flavin-dependent oxidoreductase [Gammaproteobacteria bacterium]
MRFGFYLPCYWPDTSVPAEHMYAEMLQQAIAAEEQGYCSLAIPEHHFINYLTHPSPLLSAVKVATVTQRIPIVTAVLVLPFLDMRRLAGEIAQADCLTNGRIQLGVGRGAFRYEFDRFGVPPEDSREKFDDSLALLKKLLTEEEVSWNSKYYSFPPLTITPRPVQKPHPPIWIAALAPLAIYHSVLNGYHVMTTPLRDPLEAAKAQADAFHKGLRDAGPAATDRELSMLRMVYVAKDDADARRKLEIAYANHQRFSNVFNTPGEVYKGAIKPIDVDITVDEIAQSLIICTADECVERLKIYEGFGIHEINLNMGFGADHEDVMASMKRFATKVMPHFYDKRSVA